MAKSKQTPLAVAAALWDSLEIERVDRREIVTDPAYQPRAPAMIDRAVQRLRQQQALEEMVSQIKLYLQSSRTAETEALWLVELDNKLVLVDGHHRLQAYSETHREEVPAKVYRGKNAQLLADLACRLANVRGSRVQLHRQEIVEAFWATLGNLSRNGSRSWERLQLDGYSYRSLQAQFGGQPALGTISKMVGRLPTARRCFETWKSWPTWKEIRQMLRDRYDTSKPEKEQDDEELIERLAIALAPKLEKYPEPIRVDVYHRMESILRQSETLDMRAIGFEPRHEVFDNDDF